MTKSLQNVNEIASILSDRYNDFAHHNKADPLEELIFIICSLKTSEKGYTASHQNLLSYFPTARDIHNANIEGVREALEMGGLSSQKAKNLKSMLSLIEKRFGSLTLAPLREMTDQGIEVLLTGLPGVGTKTARCVMMYSLQREVFPVDTHCWRISRRLGWVRRTTKSAYPTTRDMDRLQDHIPPKLRFSLHVNFLSLGREFCLARKPNCEICPIGKYCRRIGAKKRPPSGSK